MNPIRRTWPLALFALSCDPSGPRAEGWAATQQTGGPVVLWDAVALPLPEIPLPNDAATRRDPTSPTGRRLNISEDAPTALERDTRAIFNQMDGFGTTAPITVSFDAPLDVADLHARHNDNHDFRDDAVLVVNVDPDCDRYGEAVGLDVGGGRFPVVNFGRGERIPDPDAPRGYVLDERDNPLFLFDEHAEDRTFILEQRNEDTNGNGRLDPGEDLDLDGILDVANFIDPKACDGLLYNSIEHDQCVADHLMTFYDRGSNTLTLRPLWPLEEACIHAVLLTDRLTDPAGRSVVSPFPAVHARDQQSDLQAAEPFLGRFDLSVDQIAFAWTFTTATVTEDLQAVRKGLYGHGPFAWMAERWPVQGFRPWTRGEIAAAVDVEIDASVADDSLLPGACVAGAFTWLWSEGLEEWPPNLCAIEADLSTMGSLFFGTFAAPDLLIDKDGHATAAYDATVDEVWELDRSAGTAVAGTTEVTFWCALPVERTDGSCTPGNPEGAPFCKPFNVALYGHGYGSNRAEMSLHMGRHTQMGQAACALDFYGHGLNRWLEDPEAATTLLLAGPQFANYGIADLKGVIAIGRDRDLNSDGLPDPGADMWTADLFHTRDMLRQIVVEHMQFIRMLRHMDGETRASDGSLLGDLDGDGVVDIGGPNATLGMWGISLGGIVSGILAGAEPSLDAVSPNAGGAGLTSISVRSKEAGVPDSVVLPMIGPFIAGCLPTDSHDVPVEAGTSSDHDCLSGQGDVEGPYTGGTMRLALFGHDDARFTVREIGAVTGVGSGDRLFLENLDNGQTATSEIGPRGRFRLSVAADAFDAIERRAALGMSDGELDAVAPDDLWIADRIRLTITDPTTGALKATIDTFERDVSFQGTTWSAGSPLVVLEEGLGFARNHPDLRRFIGIAQHAIDPADPGAWAVHIRADPVDVSYDPFTTGGNTRVLMMPTAGDKQVPPDTGAAMARAAGLLGSWDRDPDQYGPESGWRALYAPDARMGMSADDFLVTTHALEGDPSFFRFPDNPIVQEVVYDVDNVSDGTAEWSCGDSDWSAIIGENNCPDELDGQEVFYGVPHPSWGGLRLDSPRGDGTADAFRLPVLRPGGQHGIYNAQSFRAFDADAYMVDFTVRYLATAGRRTDHLAGCDCSAADTANITLDGEPAYPVWGDRDCETDELKLCDEACTEGWGMAVPDESACITP